MIYEKSIILIYRYESNLLSLFDCARLNQGIPFRPIIHKEKGEFVGILKVEQIQKWLEEHPDFKLEGALTPLKDLKFDDNPVVVIVSPSD